SALGTANAFPPHTQKAVAPPPEPRSEPIGGVQRPLDIPANVQDMTPAKLPPPAIAPNAPLRPVPTIESLAQQVGMGDAQTRTPAQMKQLQMELFKEQQAQRTRQ